MIDFDIKDGRLIVSAESLTISAFRNIFESDKSKDKRQGVALLLYVYHVADLRVKNPFHDLHPEQRVPKAKRNAFRDEHYKFSKEEEAMVNEAIEWYAELNKNTIRMSLYIQNKKIYELQQLIDGTTMTLENRKAISEAMADLKKMDTDRAYFEKKARDEDADARNRGGMEASPRDKGKLQWEGSVHKINAKDSQSTEEKKKPATKKKKAL